MQSADGISDQEERKWLLALKSDSYPAFEYLYHRYKVRLAGVILRLVKSPDLADDILQDLFVRLWENRASVDPDKPIIAYLYRIGEHLVYDSFRRMAKDKRIQDGVEAFMDVRSLDMEADMIVKEEFRAAQAAIARLPPKRREVYVLCRLESKSYEEVSRLLNISISTVNDHIYKANRFLKSQLGSELVLLLVSALQAVLL